MPKRKKIRLEGYDDSSSGANMLPFVTDKNASLRNAGADIIRPCVVGNYRFDETVGVKANRISIWQKSFNDHIIRNEQDCFQIWYYIDN